MDGVLWYVLTGTRGGPNRVRLLLALRDHPRNANQLAALLDLDYTTVRHHLDILLEHDLIMRVGDGYGDIYRLTDKVGVYWETVETIAETEDVAHPAGDLA